MSESMIPMILRIRNGESVAEFRIDSDPRRTVLDMLESLRSGGGSVPAYRHSCHHGSCGTCGAKINGIESLMCLTSAASLAAPRARVPGGPAVEPQRGEDGTLIVDLEPLSKMSVISGIAVEPGTAFAGIPVDASYLKASESGERAPLPTDPTTPSLAGRVRFEACIECGLCVSSCHITVPYIGPAALAAINREREKRPERAVAMLKLAAARDGVGPCDRYMACSRVCPQAVYPAKHIQLLKNVLGKGSSSA